MDMPDVQLPPSLLSTALTDICSYIILAYSASQPKSLKLGMNGEEERI